MNKIENIESHHNKHNINHHNHNHNHSHSHSHQHGESSFLFPILMIVLFITTYSIDIFYKQTGYFLYLFVTLIGIVPLLKRSFQYLKKGYFFSLETLICTASLGAVFIHAADDAAAVLTLFIIGEYLEEYTTAKANSSVKSLASLVPDQATLVLDDGNTQKICVSELQSNQFIEIKPGERFPVDGIVSNGISSVNESLLTGESQLILKNPGDKVIAGATNFDGKLIVKTTSKGSDNYVTRLIQLVENAQSSKSKSIRTMEVFSQYYTPIVFFAAIIITIFPPLFGYGTWLSWIYKGLSVLLIGCPCALIISTPSAIAAGITAASRFGVLVKSASAIEILAKVKTIAFDKTGTITTGQLQITDTIPFANLSEDEFMNIAASIGNKSNHPLAKAIVNWAYEKKICLAEPKNITEIPGKGIRGTLEQNEIFIISPNFAKELNVLTLESANLVKNIQNEGKTVNIILKNNFAVGLISFQDQLKNDSKDSLKKLQKFGIQNFILTGDSNLNSEQMTKNLEAQVYSELLPQDKLIFIQNLCLKNTTAMVGDGINDAPALAAADVGISMGTGSDLAINSAQIIITNNNLSSLVNTVFISRKMMNNIKQNITLALGIKILFLIYILLDGTKLWPAVLADSGAAVIVTLNAMRLLLINKKNIKS